MTPNGHPTNPEDEYFARRAGEIERDRNRRAAVREEHDEVAERGHDGAEPTGDPTSDPPERGARIVAAMSTALKALFGIRGNRRRRIA